MRRELRRRHFNFILQLAAQLEVFCLMGFYRVYILFIAKEKLGAQRWEALGWDGVVLQLLPGRGLGEVRWLLSYSSTLLCLLSREPALQHSGLWPLSVCPMAENWGCGDTVFQGTRMMILEGFGLPILECLF